jgi:GNAT superfamily N-acetyltransferase
MERNTYEENPYTRIHGKAGAAMTSIAIELQLREGLPAERDAIIAVTLAAYEQYDAVMPPGAWEAYATSIRETFTNDTTSARIIAVEQHVIVGSALLLPPVAEPPIGRVAQPYPEIRLVAVAPKARRRGVATAVLNECIRRTRAEGYGAIGLHSTQYMADAIRIYERMGFVRAPEHDFHPPSGVLVMGFRLDLAV